MKKELEKAAFDYINSEAVKDENMQLAFGDFINGAEWMQKKMIDKACEWLQKYFVEDHYGMSPSGFCVFADMFIKAMEE